MKRLITLLIGASALVLTALPAQAGEDGGWIARVGLATVQPDDKNLDLLGDGSVYVEVDDSSSLALNFTYMFTPNWGLDILAAYPFSHDITLAGDEVASTDHLPPTISALYSFAPDGKFQPYVGVGLNYTTFFSTDTKGALDGTKLDLDDSFGLALQLGVDIPLSEKWLLNLNVRSIAIETDAKLDGAPLGTVEIDPWVYSVTTGYRF